MQIKPVNEGPLRLRWVMVSFAFFATVLNYVDRLAFNYLGAEGVLRKLIPDDSFGYIATAFFVAYMVSNAFSGFAIDRLGTRLGYSICMFFWTTSSMLHALARTPFHFGIARFFLGVGEAGNWPAAIKLISEWFPSAERATASGIFNSGAAVGAVVAPPLIAYLGTTYGWQIAFITIGCVGYLWIVTFWFTYYTPKQSLSESKKTRIPWTKLIKNTLCSDTDFVQVLHGPRLVFYYFLDWPVSCRCAWLGIIKNWYLCHDTIYCIRCGKYTGWFIYTDDHKERYSCS